MASGGPPCGACKFLRRKCEKGCIFAPYFGVALEQGINGHGQDMMGFEAVHKVFGASNVSKMLQRIPLPELRREAVMSISYEAQARMSDPIYGCVSHIIALQHQVAGLQAELTLVQAQLANRFTSQYQPHLAPSPQLSGYNGNASPASCVHLPGNLIKDENQVFPSTHGLLTSSISSLNNNNNNNNNSNHRDNIIMQAHEHNIMNEHELQALANVILLQKSCSI